MKRGLLTMDWICNTINTLWIAIFGYALCFWGGLDVTVQHLFVGALVFLVLNTISGIWLAGRKKEIDAEKFAHFFSKVAIYLIVIIATITIDYCMIIPFDSISLIIMAIVVRELLSIIQNTNELGFPWPNVIINAVKKIETDTQEDENV